MIKYEEAFNKEFNNDFGTPYWCCGGDFCSKQDHIDEATDIKNFIEKCLLRQIDEDNKRFLGMLGFDEECRFSSLGYDPCGNCEDCGANQLRAELRDKVNKG